MIKYATIFVVSLVSFAAAADFWQGGAFLHPGGSGIQDTGSFLDIPPFTPGYHNGNDMVCSDCHIMHASMQHNYGYQDSYSYPYNVNPPANHLLKAPDALTLCLSCHNDKVGIPDVIGDDVNGGVQRAAGQFGENGEHNNNGHNIGPDPDYVCERCHSGGNLYTATVECIDCHAPHGTGYYRNLQWASLPGHQRPIIAFVRPGTQGLQKYQASNIRFTAPGAGENTWREVTNICVDCHHRLIDAGPNGGRFTNPDMDEHWNRHPVTNSEYGAYRPIGGLPGDPIVNTDPQNWVDGQGSEFSVGRVPFIVTEAHSFEQADVVSSSNEVFCLSCHYAHGSDRPFGLRWNPTDNSNPIATAGCRQCHDNVTGNIP